MSPFGVSEESVHLDDKKEKIVDDKSNSSHNLLDNHQEYEGGEITERPESKEVGFADIERRQNMTNNNGSIATS